MVSAAAKRAMLDCPWLTAERARAYAVIVAAGSVLFAAGLGAIFVAGALHSPSGLSYSCDFNAFWSAARLALLGHPGSAWVPNSIRAMQEQNAQPIAHGGYIAYPYPPIFQLLTLPLGALRFRIALPIFLAGGIALFFLAERRLLPPGWPAVSVLAAPAVLVDAASTQNGWITASVFAASMRLIETQPFLAGALLSCLSFKPQMAVCVVPGLLASRRWAALGGFAAGVSVLCLVSWAVLGPEPWTGFWRSMALSRAMGQSRPSWGTGQSLYAALRILGASSPAGFAAQGVASVAAMLTMLAVCWRRPGGRAELATIAAGTIAVTPYVLDYDLMVLLPPLAFVANAACARGWRPGEKPVLALVYLYPFVARNLSLAGVPLGPTVIALCLFTLSRRAARP